MNLLSNAIDGNSSVVQQSYFSAVRASFNQCCQQIYYIFTNCLSNCRDSSDTEIPLSGVRFRRLEENIESTRVANVFSVRYSQKESTASEKIKKQLRFALKDPRQNMSCDEKFVFSDLIQKVEPAVYASFSSAVAQHLGSRETQEDGFLEQSEVEFEWKEERLKALLFGVFDGHRDKGEVSRYLNRKLIPSLEALLTKAQYEYEELGDEVISNAFAQVFNDLSESYQKENINRGGAVITCAFVIGDTIYIPNVGDSRTILIKEGHTLPLTEDGFAGNPRFQKWHTARGHTILRFLFFDGVHRIWGDEIDGAVFARDIGTRSMCSRPKITKVTIGDGVDDLDEGVIFCKKGDFLLLASDGLWDAATTAEAGEAVREFVRKGFSLQEIAAQIAFKAGEVRRSDNVTVKIIAI